MFSTIGRTLSFLTLYFERRRSYLNPVISSSTGVTDSVCIIKLDGSIVTGIGCFIRFFLISYLKYRGDSFLVVDSSWFDFLELVMKLMVMILQFDLLLFFLWVVSFRVSSIGGIFQVHWHCSSMIRCPSCYQLLFIQQVLEQLVLGWMI